MPDIRFAELHANLNERTEAGKTEIEIQSTESTRVPATPHFIAPLIYICATRHGAVVLDLKRNRYLGIDRFDAMLLSKRVRGFSKRDIWLSAAAETSANETSDADLLRSFVSAGIITTEPGVRDQMLSANVSLDGPLASVGEEIISPTRVRFRHCMAFMMVFLGSAISLRYRPLLYVVSKVYRRHSIANARGYQFSLERVSKLVYIFRSLRPYFFLARDNCLLHALMLVNFLAHYGEYAHWVFGVSSDPWVAHSWVQHDYLLLDGTPEKVCSLEVILAI
jgi:hypothetical protein